MTPQNVSSSYFGLSTSGHWLSQGWFGITLFELPDVTQKGETPFHQVAGLVRSWMLLPAPGMLRRLGCNSKLQDPELGRGATAAHCLEFPPRTSSLQGI